MLCYSEKTEEDPQEENVAVVSEKIEEIKKESERKGESECNIVIHTRTK